MASQIGTAIANAEAYEAERKRAEALAQIDRAKTTFFSNVSHEFRTPLTLMIGPLEDALADAGGLTPAQRERLDIAHRNSLRLQRLVNSLLDFSRIEAGRVQAAFRRTDLGGLTRDLASSFRAATDKAGLRLIVEAPPLTHRAYVDRDMWEKIVLNLVSNAFKFTLQGEIRVGLAETGRSVQLTVADTGIGIPAAELPKLFERFHRVEGASGRSFEGSGIGLALVSDLVQLHGGTINVASAPGHGTTFTVELPLGSAHLPAEQVEEAAEASVVPLRAAAFVEEALRWVPAPATGNAQEEVVRDLSLGMDRAHRRSGYASHTARRRQRRPAQLHRAPAARARACRRNRGGWRSRACGTARPSTGSAHHRRDDAAARRPWIAAGDPPRSGAARSVRDHAVGTLRGRSARGGASRPAPTITW